MKGSLRYAIVLLGEGLRRLFWAFLATFALAIAQFYLGPILVDRLGWKNEFFISSFYRGKEGFKLIQERDLAGYLGVYFDWAFPFLPVLVLIFLFINPPRMEER
ncbi:hypothetical protein Mlute_02784 [Meiothermus luteus]|uniref:Uncharacterized protein n=1 Tax=Meiothermus luteus TaxID=2026184 RepID=A0A399ECH9_9DEIN|nr:hypothetical protein [Meiothermus luteus]RIH81506.1 hypothetical protein Mlute_02784 [Meiothermus luteus]